MKKYSFKVIAALMAMLMACFFALTACSKGQGNATGGSKPDVSIVTPIYPDKEDGDDNPPSGSTTNPDNGKEDDDNKGDYDPPVIPDEETGVKIVLPKNVDREILSYAYSSIALELVSCGYNVFNAYAETDNGKEYGIAYTDYEEGYQVDGDSKIYLASGFLGYSVDQTVSESDELLFAQPVDENAEEIYDNTYGYVISCVENGLPSGHFVGRGKYVQYSVSDGKVDIEVFDNIPKNYDLSRGSIWDYDREEYVYIPFDEIDSTPIQFVPLTENIDYAAIKASLYQLIEEQTKNGYSVQTITISFLSVETLNALKGILAQGDTLNGYTFDALNSIEFDSAKQYINFNDDGTITIKDLPPIPVTEYKTIFDWLIDGLILVGAGAIAIVSVTFLGPAGGVIAGAVLGAGIEYFSQTVIQGKKFTEVNWAKVGIMAVSGALGTMVPCSGVLGYIAAGALGGLTSAALTAVDGGSWQDILISAGTGALTSMLMHGLFASCFPAGTQILTKEGYVAIELISVGMLVASYNIYSHMIEWMPVLNTFENYTTQLTRLCLSNGEEILSTSNHLFYLAAEGNYISANKIQRGDELLLSSGQRISVIASETITFDSAIPTYNLNIDQNHNYYVGNSSILVHNECGFKNKVVSQKVDDKYGYLRIDLEQGGSGQYNLHLHKDNMKYWFDGVSGFSGAGKVNKTSFVQNGVKKALEFLSKLGGSL